MQNLSEAAIAYINNLRSLIINTFADLEFDEDSHTYTLDGSEYRSVSKTLERFYNPFDEDGVSLKYALKHGRTQEDVLNEWHAERDRSTTLGHRVHDFAERYCWDRTLVPSDGFEQSVVNFFNAIPSNYVPLLTETKVYSRRKKYAGTFDLLMIDTNTGGLVIVDYKTNKDLYKNFMGKRMRYPFGVMLDTPESKYKIQLSLYQLPLNEMGLNTLGHRIIWLKEDGTFKSIPGTDFTNVLDVVL